MSRRKTGSALEYYLLFFLLLFKYVVNFCSKIYQLEKGWEISDVSINKHNFCSNLNFWLTHYSPVLLFHTPWKYQKTFRFPDVFRGYRRATPGCNGLKLHKIKTHSFIYYIIHKLCGHLRVYFFLCLYFQHVDFSSLLQSILLITVLTTFLIFWIKKGGKWTCK